MCSIVKTYSNHNAFHSKRFQTLSIDQLAQSKAMVPFKGIGISFVRVERPIGENQTNETSTIKTPSGAKFHASYHFFDR